MNNLKLKMNHTKSKKWRKNDCSNSPVPQKRRKIHFKTKPMAEELRRYNKDNNASEIQEDKKKGKKMGTYKKAFAEYERIKSQKKRERDEAIKRKMEIRDSLDRYKKNKRDKFKKLSAKTKKGQPIMKNRIEMLLEKIQSSQK